LAALGVGAGGVDAQVADTPAGVAGAVARAWGSGRVDALEALFAPRGLTLRLEGVGHVGVGSRQARASIEAFLGRYEPGRVAVRRAEVLGGDPPRAMAELEWEALPRGTREAIEYVIFLGLERIDGRWVVVEIRTLP
jgi:hypothetical protein